ncbi:MAG TPA: hypothetical protein EYG85_07615 [Crocinitomix sp.]|nr:hypothetical protein [Crocinitomix sp.]
MKNKQYIFLITVLVIISCGNVSSETNFINNTDSTEIKLTEPVLKLSNAKKVSEITPPVGYARKNTTPYGKWIRNIKLTEENIVYYYNGSKKNNQNIHVAVLDFDIGNRNLQQCADACMRIRAEYLFENKRYSEIRFLFASGEWAPSYAKYTTKRSRKSFRSYMNYVYAYANTASLKKQLKSVKVKDIKIGDVFVQSGNPYGHAVTVMDVVTNENGNKKFMLSQSYMPAQSIEILINPKNNSAWYSADFEGDLVTPEWTFTNEDLKRF